MSSSNGGGPSWWSQAQTSDTVPTPNSNNGGAQGVLRGAQHLLGTYPFASATPTTHVARHLSNLTITATPPSYVQPGYYSSGRYNGSGQNGYGESSYQHQVLTSQTIPAGGPEREYWDASRSETIRHLNESSQQSSAYNYYQAPQSHWNPNPAPSSYHPPAFAQSIIQHAAPYNAYPTPPPPSINATFSSSSSSLANALGGGPAPNKPKTFPPSESKAFFNDFVSKTVKDIPPQKPRVLPEVVMDASLPSTPTKQRLQQRSLQKELPQSSPDPLRMGYSSPLTPLTMTSQATPKKRKIMEVLIDTPSKRPHSSDLPPSSPSKTPQTATSSTLRKPGSRDSSAFAPPKMEVFVEITPTRRPFSTPSHSRTHSDLGGYGQEDDDIRRMSVKSSLKRTGGRDDRAPLEKFENCVEEIFESEDNISPDTSPSALPGEFFSHLSVDAARPLLSAIRMRKLTKYVSKVAHPTKRQRLNTWDPSGGTPRRSGGMAEVEVNILSRVLKMLERSVKAGEDLDPFPQPVKAMQDGGEAPSASPSKPSKGKAAKAKTGDAKRSKSPQEPGNEPNADEVNVSEDDFNNLERTLEIARDGLLAADCCLAILSSDRLTKQLYSEELITSCLSAVKNQLIKILYPFVEAPSSASKSDCSPLLAYIVHRRPSGSSESIDTAQHRQLINEIFQALSSIIPRINALVCAGDASVAMSDTIVIQAVYIAIGPFFVVESSEPEGKGKKTDFPGAVVSNTLGSSAMRGLRLEALSLIRSIFANYVDQRSWIIEEILSSLIKLSDTKQKAGQFRLRNGQSIRTVSALLLQLVQTSAHNVRTEARRIARARQQQTALRRQDSTANAVEPFLDDQDLEEVQLYSNSLDAPSKAAKSIIVFLTQRSGKSKSTKNSNEAEYRTIFDNLISDLLTVLFWPEWPAASLVLSIVCKFMITSLDDIKSANQNDNNASKSMALEHLGVIAGKIRSNMLKIASPSGDKQEFSSKPLDEIIASGNAAQLEKLISIHREVSAHLSRRAVEEQSYESARELSAVLWGQELAASLNTLSNVVSEDPDANESSTRKRTVKIGHKVRNALRDVWKEAPLDVFDNTTQEEITHVDRLTEQLGAIQILKNAFDPILNVILLVLDAPAVFMRTKALRALSQILTVDSSVLSNMSVRRAIESHLLDSSPQVRDAAVELIGKYMIDSPTVASEYYPKIAERIADTGLAVRKRVIKLLKSYYGVTNDLGKKTDVCTKLVLRMLDEDDSVKDLAVKTLEELWFPVLPQGSAKSLGQTENKTQLLVKVSVIMGVSGNFRDRQSPLEQVLSKIVAGKEGAEISALHDNYSEICDTMIDGLVDASEFTNFSVVNCIRTVHLFTSAYPPVISGSKASTLLPYLKNPVTAEEQVTSDYILRIYRTALPHMSKTSAKFGNDLQLILQPMVVKPNAAAGLAALQETVACLCAVVQHLTHDFKRLAALLKSCNMRVQQFIKRPAEKALSPQESRALTMLMYIVSLLGEHAGFDAVRTQQTDINAELNYITTGSIVSHIYSNVLALYEKFEDSGLRGRLLQCLGFLFKAQPTLMTLESSATMMDAIFASDEDDSRARLLRLMQEFLIAESEKHSEQEKNTAKQKTSGVNMDELVGNTQGFAESGVSSAIVQRYMTQILDAALSNLPNIQNSAVDILTFTIKQGLAHPLQSFPIIIALETSSNPQLSSRANALHILLHHKHASLLNAGYISACRASFDYQAKLGPVQGYRMEPNPNALLNRWYALVREKRANRQEYLKAIVKVFDVDDVAKTSQDDVDFVRYMVENVASLDYRTQEEVLTVIKYVTSVLSTTGMQLSETIAPAYLLNQLRGSQSTMEQPDTLASPRRQDLSSRPFEQQLAVVRSSVVIGLLMLMKAYLKTMYGLSEEKCSKFVVGKKSNVGDRPATRRKEVPISWDRMPFAAKPILTQEDIEEQKNTFMVVWSEDGSTAEPEVEEWE
ncbi:hypothetical protein SCHPADRAFT_1002012 [Schizopora paradoxa]|uniref:Sister chromatid cohesion protein n=1 Tax=Schizopora paradoxa TaxID=27342 RepID=A0A0H2R547_9AGAM|nr:hypothetical protein SCHPADRAFT_1002012 [Schizopora paradoxa]